MIQRPHYDDLIKSTVAEIVQLLTGDETIVTDRRLLSVSLNADGNRHVSVSYIDDESGATHTVSVPYRTGERR